MSSSHQNSTGDDMEQIGEESGADLHTLLATIVSVVYGIISLGFFSNVIVAIIVGNILIRLGSTLPNRHMLVYVFVLCIVDALVLGTLPMLIVQIYLQKWIFGQTLCTIYWTVDSINKTLSTFILLCLSFDRYLAVRYPHRCTNFRTVKGALYILTACIIFAALLLMPVYLHAEITYVEIDPVENGTENTTQVPTCAFTGQTSFISTIFVLCYFVPFACMTFFYGCMLVQLRNRSRKLGVRQGRIRRVTTKTLTLVISYFICWTPYWIVTMRAVISEALQSHPNDADSVIDSAPSSFPSFVNVTMDENDEENSGSSFLLNALTFGIMYATHSGCYLNSAINPILYALLNRELRRQHYAAMSAASRTGVTASLVLFNSGIHNGTAKHSTSGFQSSPNAQRAQQPLLTGESDKFLSPSRGASRLASPSISSIPRSPTVAPALDVKKRKGKFWIWKIYLRRRRDVQCEANETAGAGTRRRFKYKEKDFIVANNSGCMVEMSSCVLSSDSDKSVPVLL